MTRKTLEKVQIDKVRNGIWYALLTRSDEGDWGVRAAELVDEARVFVGE